VFTSADPVDHATPIRVITRHRNTHRYVEQAIAASKGNLSAAARRSSITRAALHRIVKRLGIAADDDEGDELGSTRR
jgi:transcriptional regulator of acetoin/glycerol metabolism